MRIARHYLVRGRVQGVGFRAFVEARGLELGMDGYARNLDDGRVEVFAMGTEEQHSALAGHLWNGPRAAEVRGVETTEASMLNLEGFRIRR